MHLLSAVLQEAEGMTALEFARLHLFGPLGIGEVLWRADPQGYTRGWGDLYLKPSDAARIGYLWLTGGVWEGRQVVPATWVHEAVAPHSHGQIDDYGYGWWVSSDSYYALGRGGQNIKVYPSLKAVVVVTGRGVEYDDVGRLLQAALVNPDAALPANPEAEAELRATVARLSTPPTEQVVIVPPEILEARSGTTYRFGPNAVDLASLRLEFDGGDVATQTMDLGGAEVTWPIGLDGRFRLSSDGLGLRGRWTDPNTFLIEIFEDTLTTLRLRFEGDRLRVFAPGLGVDAVGQLKEP
jgi:hypothetical protein